jgi:flagellar basal body-associated protein FliL
MEDDDTKISGNELGDSDSGEVETDQAGETREISTAVAQDKSPRRKRKLFLFAGLGVCVAILMSCIAWNAFFKAEEKTTAVIYAIRQEDSILALDSFVIPCSGGNFTYIALNVSFKVPAGPLRNEMEKKRAFIRAKIYDLLKTYIDQPGEIPIPEAIKDLIAKGVNGALSKGRVNELYLTQFLLI